MIPLAVLAIWLFIRPERCEATQSAWSLEIRAGAAKSPQVFSRPAGFSSSLILWRGSESSLSWGVEIGFARLASQETTFTLFDPVRMDSLLATERISAGNAFFGVALGMPLPLFSFPNSLTLGAGLTTKLGSVRLRTVPFSDPSGARESTASESGGIGPYVRAGYILLPVTIGRSIVGGFGIEGQAHANTSGGVATYVVVDVIVRVSL